MEKESNNVIELTRKDRAFLDGVVALRDPESEASKQLAFWGWMWSQAGLPHKNPGKTTDVWGRRNGAFQLTVQSGVEIDEDGNKKYTGIPFGNIPRLLMAWMCTEAVKTQDPKLHIGASLNEFFRKVGLGAATGGRWGSIPRVKDQMRRLFEARISYRWGGETYAGRARRDMQISKEDVLWWSDKSPGQSSLFQSYVVLSDDFFYELTKHPIPIKLEALRLLKQSPLALDLYTWICWRIYKVNQDGQPARIPWRALQKQFGTGIANPKRFAQNCKQYLARIEQLYPELRFDVSEPGLLILHPSRLHVAATKPVRKSARKKA